MTSPSGILQQSVMSGPRIHIMVVKKSKAIEKTQRGVLANNYQRSKTCAYTVASVFPSVGSAALQTLVSYEDHSTRAESRGPSRARSSARSSVTRKSLRNCFPTLARADGAETLDADGSKLLVRAMQPRHRQTPPGHTQMDGCN